MPAHLSRRMPRLPLFIPFILLIAACSGGKSAPAASDDGGVASTEQAITAQPDPSCTYARLGVHDYWVCTAAKNFSASKAVCEGVGMHLVRVDNAAENDFVKGLLAADSWIGATDSVTEKTWRWINDNAQFWNGNRPGTAVGGLYNKWTSVEPNDLFGEDCGIMVQSSGEWNDIACSLSRSFVCESAPATGGQPQAPDTACTRTTRNGATYWTCSNARSWDTARANCQSIGADLVSIDDAAEASFLAPSFTRETHIGLSDKKNEGTWRWSATDVPSFCGTSGGRTPYGSYSNWASGQPYRANDCQQVVLGSRAYWICQTPSTWMAADEECRASGMSLARIDDAAENALIYSKIAVDTWLGGNDRAAEGSWRWTDNVQFWNSTGSTTGVPVGGRYANFDPVEPNDLFGENCLLMYKSSGQWNDSMCEAPLGGIGFACEGPANSPHPDSNDCAYAKTGGTWSSSVCSTPRAYVCESVPANANPKFEDVADKIRENHQAGSPRVTGFDVKAGVQIKEPFIGREERLGLRTCEDSLEPSGTPEVVTSTGLERVAYDQKLRGVRVYGRGFTVMRDKTTKYVKSALGELAPNLTVATTPTFTEAQALSSATAAVGRSPSNYTPTPRGELVLFPKQQGRTPDWELSWLFRLPRLTSTDGHTVVVSALSGASLSTIPATQYCTTSALPSQPVQQFLPMQVYQHGEYNDPNLLLATVPANPTATAPTYLLSTGTGDPSWIPEIAATCGDRSVFLPPIPAGATTPASQRLPVMRGPALPLVYDSKGGAPTDEETGAATLLAVQTSLNNFYKLFEIAPNVPWKGIDGVGLSRIDLQLGPGVSAYHQGEPATGSSPGSREYLHFDTTEPPPPAGAALDIAAHELGHAIFGRFTLGTSRDDLESRAVSEGFSDILGAAVETSERIPEKGTALAAGAYCFDGDRYYNDPDNCRVNSQTPYLSGMQCMRWDAGGNALNAVCPRAYQSPDYCFAKNWCPRGTAEPRDCCDEHFNSTVFSHWYYLVTAGSDGTDPSTCGTKVEKLSGDPLEAAKIASTVVFNALRDKQFSNVQYPGIAEATVKAAEALDTKLGRTNIRDTVVRAWNRVNVLENVSGTATATVFPKRGAEKVNPWMTFAWPRFGSEEAWDFQLDDDGFRGGFKYEKRGITTTAGTPKSPYHALALPENSTKHYVWRVRPAGGDDWSCYPTHWFEGTGKLVEPSVSLGPVDSNGRLVPGTAGVSFSQIPLLPEAIHHYNVQLAKDNSVACAATNGVPRFEVLPHNPTFDESGAHYVPFAGVQPNATYHAEVQAFGPPGLLDKDDQPTPGPCVVKSITTGPPTKPLVSSPVNGQRFNLYSPHERDPDDPSAGPANLALTVTLDSWMKSVRVEFRKRTATGCGDVITPATIVREAPASCDGQLSCRMTITDLPFDTSAYPGGYCWDAYAIGTGGTPVSEPARGLWRYFVNVSSNRSPGAPAASLMPAPLPGDSYGRANVTLDWDTVQSAVSYRVKLWSFLEGYGQEQLTNREIWPNDPSLHYDAAHTEALVYAPIPSKGRHCWELFPEIEDPDSPGNPMPDELAPKINSEGPLCYTSGPSLPVIGPASPPTRGYDAKDIVDEVLFKYVPDNQITANNGADWDWEPTTEPWCTTLNQVFKDVVNCKRKFRVRAAEGKTVKMEISVYNGAGAAGSTPSGKPVFTAKKDVVFGRCGGNNEACCPAPNKCDAPTLACNGSDTCVGCGVKDAICCPNEPKCGTGTGLTCQSGFCKVPCDTLSSAPQFLDPGLPDLHCEGGELANEYPTDPIWMTWNPVLNAKKYEITIRRSLAEQVNVACVNPIGSVDEVTITTPDDKPEYYYRVPQVFGPQAIAWKVRAINNCGDKGPESAWAHTWPNYSLW